MSEVTVSKENQEIFLKSLRSKTANSHQQLEESKYSKSILSPSVTLNSYQTYIAKMYGFVKACERDVFPFLNNIVPDLALRNKASLIKSDLKATGIAVDLTEELPVHLFTVSNVAQAMGIMYVLEGSTLGVKFLYKHINEVLKLDEKNGASYFWGYGQRTGLLWKTFIAAMADFAVNENCEDEIISSASQTFGTIAIWLDQTEIKLA